MTLALLAPHAALLAAGTTLTVLCLQEGHRGRHTPGHGRTRPHNAVVGTAQQDHNAIKEYDMGYARYDITRNGQTIKAGYAVEATCEEPECSARIDRGLDYLCGQTPGGDEHGCGGYFCGQHLYGDNQCSRCLPATQEPTR